jgi:hypothetical protein
MPNVAIGNPVVGEGEVSGVGLLQAGDDQPQNRVQYQESQYGDQRQPQQDTGVQTPQSGSYAGKLQGTVSERFVGHDFCTIFALS